MRRPLVLVLIFLLVCLALLAFDLIDANGQGTPTPFCVQLNGNSTWLEIGCATDEPTPTPTNTPTASATPSPTPTNTATPTSTPSSTPSIEPTPTQEIGCLATTTDNLNVRAEPWGTRLGVIASGEHIALTGRWLSGDTWWWYAVEYGGWVHGGYLVLDPAGYCDTLPDSTPHTVTPWVAPNKRGIHLIVGVHEPSLYANLADYGNIKGTTSTEQAIKVVASISPDTILVWRNLSRGGHTGDGPPLWGEGDPVQRATAWWWAEYQEWQRLGLIGVVDLFEYRNELGFMGDWEVAFDLRMLELATDAGICLAVFSDGYGNPLIEEFNQRRPVLDYILTHECQPGRRHVIAEHSYGAYYSPDADWTVFRWQMQRARWRELWGTDKYDAIQWIFSEYGVPNINGEHFGIGPPDCARPYAEWAYMRPIYDAAPEVIGVHIFAMGGGGAYWLDWGVCLQ